MADFLNSTGLTQVLQAVKRAVPTTLAALSDDATHRLVTDTEKSAWNNKADVFIAVYDSTTQDEVLAAATAGKMVVCYYNNRLYMYAGTSAAGYCQFTSLLYDTAFRVYLKKSSWGNATLDIPTDVVQYTSQNLSDSQKTQARTNIGAGTYSKPSAGIPASDLASGVIPDALTSVEIQNIWDSVMNNVTLISFTINDTTYQAEDEMTWHEWVSSAYNTGGFYSDGDNVYCYVRAQNSQTIMFDNVSEKSINVIVDERAYTYNINGGGND